MIGKHNIELSQEKLFGWTGSVSKAFKLFDIIYQISERLEQNLAEN